MKKSTGVLTLVVALAVAYTGASWYVGTKTENAIRAQVNSANEYLRLQGAQFDQLKIEIASYERSVFSANASYVLSFSEPGDEETYELVFNDKIAHGPIPFAAGSFAPAMAVSHIELQNNNTTGDWFALTDGKVPLYADTIIALTGKADSKVEFTGFKKNLDGHLIDFSGGHFITALDSKAKNYTGKFNFDHLILDSIEATPFQVTFNKLYGDFDYSGELYVNDKQTGKLVLEKALIESEDVNASFNNFEISGSSETKDEVLNGQASYKVSSIKLNDQDVGTIDAGVNLNNIYTPGLLALSDLSNRLSANPDLDNLSDEEVAQFLKEIPAILERKPSFSIDPLSWTNSAGTSGLSIKVDLQSSENLLTDFSNPLPWLEVVREVQLSVRLSRPMLEKLVTVIAQTDDDLDIAEAMYGIDQLFEAADGLQSMGLVKTTDNGVESVIIYRGSESESLLINDVPVPVTDLFMMGMGLLM